MTIAVLPRATASAIINRAISRGIWVVALIILVLDLPGLLDVFWRRGFQEYLVTPLIALLVMICALIVAAQRPASWVVALYLLVGGVCVTVYQLGILSADPSLASDATYLVNRPAVAIVLVGTLSSSTIVGILWCLLGYAVSIGASVVAAQIIGQAFVPGYGPTLVIVLYITVYAALGLVQRRQRGRVPDFARVEEESRRIEAERDLARRTVTVVHDTVLSDLSFIINAPDALDEPARERLRSDVATLTSAEWLSQTGDVAEANRSEAVVRNRLASVVSEMQWRGLTVHLSGNGSTVLRATTEAGTAAVDAARACLENVLAHSGVTVAQLVVGQEDGESTIMVIDEGSGFDPDAVPQDRLGIRVAVVQRVEAVGGHVRIWSSPGNGTSVLISVHAVSDPAGGDDDAGVAAAE
jgi:signal transduction histidine kinase